MNERFCRRYVLAILCPAAVIMLSIALAVSYGIRNQSGEGIQQVQITAAESLSQIAEPQFTVCNWQGHVAVFEKDVKTPVVVLETPVASLPEADQTALAEGIAVYDREILASILEDYGS